MITLGILKVLLSANLISLTRQKKISNKFEFGPLELLWLELFCFPERMAFEHLMKKQGLTQGSWLIKDWVIEHRERYKSMDQQGTVLNRPIDFKIWKMISSSGWDWETIKGILKIDLFLFALRVIRNGYKNNVLQSLYMMTGKRQGTWKVRVKKQNSRDRKLRYSMEPVASKAQGFEEHLRDLLESLGEMIR
ncbi:hypothetical protein ACH5RR_025677 [Cinchona calisaya]|uniref:Uncharacterized protein n=1 Tax=Cinchona calisaya TaxID=153742 RepID=A0ABD2Z0C2_9GENT